MKRSTILIVAVVGAALAVGTTAAAHSQGSKEHAKGAQIGMNFSEAQAKRHVSRWPDASKDAANAMIDRYGAPDEVTATTLVWHDNGPWLRTTVFKEEIDHDFPLPHKDVLEQVIPYKIDARFMDELTEFDGSVYADRTKGELAVHCDKEAANFLALNLANRIIKGDLSVDDARSTYARTIAASLRGEKPQLMAKLQFSPPGKLAARDAGEQLLRARAAEEIESPMDREQEKQKQIEIEKEKQKQKLENDY